jgi:hypothetical protein
MPVALNTLCHDQNDVLEFSPRNQDASRPPLEKIEFWECAGVTNAGLALLAGLPRLREITVGGSPNVTREGMTVFPSAVRVNYS